jgi:hypothetical protein
MRAKPILLLVIIVFSMLFAPLATSEDYLIVALKYPDADKNVNAEHRIVIQGDYCTVVVRAVPDFYGGGFLIFDTVDIVAYYNTSIEVYTLDEFSYYVPEENTTYTARHVQGFTTDCAGEGRVYVNGMEIIGAYFAGPPMSQVKNMLKQESSSKTGDPLGFIYSFFEFLGAGFGAFMQMLVLGFQAIGNILGGGLSLLGQVIGHPGDPMAQFYAAQYRLALTQYENNPYIGDDVKAVLNCTKPLKEVKGLIPSLRPEDADKTICQVEASTPQGIVGFMSTVWIVVSRAGDIVIFIVKNFVLINAVIMVSLLAYGVAGSIKRRSLDPLFSSLHVIYSIFKFYWSIGVFLFNAGLRFVQAAAQLGSVLIQLGEKIYTAVKTAITVIVEIVKTYIIYSIAG